MIMADVFDSKKRSDIMSKVRSNNNKSTELALIKFFKENNITGWKRNYPVKGHPDFVFLDKKIAVFVDGCFWHGHQNCRYFVMPKSNTEYWESKIKSNITRDKTTYDSLSALGWNVLIVWECELKKDKRDITLERLFYSILGY